MRVINNNTPMPNTFIDALQWRYATKAYDTTKKINPAQLERLFEALRLAPSSFGLQPYVFISVENIDLRSQLREAGYDQPQITDASHLIVFAVPNSIDDAFIDTFVQLTAKIRNVSVESLTEYGHMMKGTINAMTPENRKEWATRQAYIALGILLCAAANENIDATPMEGFNPAAFDKILDLEVRGLESKAIVALGYRSEGDAFAKLQKVRRSKEELIITIA
jgi:nitroreductase / dihydropteridine reductase